MVWDSVLVSAVIALSPADSGDSTRVLALSALSPRNGPERRARHTHRAHTGCPSRRTRPVLLPLNSDLSVYLDIVSCFVDGLN